MERKKKDKKKSAAATSQEPDTNGLLSKEEQNQHDEALASKNNRADSDSPSQEQDNQPSQNQECPSILQWPFTSQYTMEQPFSGSTPGLSSLSPPSVVVSQWNQLPPHSAQSTSPFWLHQQPGYRLPGVSAPATVFQAFSPLGIARTSWNLPAVIGSGASLKDHSQVPGFCYQVGFPYPGFLGGPWDPSSWWGQVQQSLAACATFPGAYGYFSSQPPFMPGSSASLGQSLPRGIIKPQAKLSQKHQQLWDAQSSENVQLWTVIGQLQSEISDYKSRVIKLEAEISSYKKVAEETTAAVTANAASGQVPRKGRPKRSVASLGASLSLDESQPQSRGRKAARSKVPTEAKALIFEKVTLEKLENKEKAHGPPSATQKEEKISNTIPDNNGDMLVDASNLMMPSLHNFIHQETIGIQMCGVGLSSSQEMKCNTDTTVDPNNALANFSLQARDINSKHTLPTCFGARNIGWPSTITSEDGGRNASHVNSQSFYNNGNVIREVGKVIPGWNFVNEEDASEELEEAVITSAKVDNEEEMGDDANSSGEETAGTRVEDLPQFGHW